MAQSAINVPQGTIEPNFIRQPVRVYVRTGGDDLLGDGTLGNPFASYAKALYFLNQFVFIEEGRATIDIGPGVFTSSTTAIVNNTQSDKINIEGVSPTSFNVRRFVTYEYDEGSHINNFMTLELVKASDPQTVSVEGIEVGDWVLVENFTLKTSPSYKARSVDHFGLTGSNGGSHQDRIISLLGCFEVAEVDEVSNLIKVRTRAKNHKFQLGNNETAQTCTVATPNIASGSPVFSGGTYGSGSGRKYDGFGGYVIGQEDPGGVGINQYYGTTASSGVPEGTDPIQIDHKDTVRVKVMKTILRTLSDNIPYPAIKLRPNSNFGGVSNVVFVSASCRKNYHELNPTHSAPAIILEGNNSFGNSKSLLSQNLGFSGWYAGILATQTCAINVNSMWVSNCSFGLALENNSSCVAKDLIFTGCDVTGIYLNNNSSMEVENYTVGLAGYNYLLLDLKEDTTENLEALNTGWVDLPSGSPGSVPAKVVYNPAYYKFENSYGTEQYSYYPIWPKATRGNVYLFALLEEHLSSETTDNNLYHFPNVGRSNPSFTDGLITDSSGTTYEPGETSICPENSF